MTRPVPRGPRENFPGALASSGTGPPLPVPDHLSAPFWAAAQVGRLAIQRCGGCLRYQYPPGAYCHTCMSTELVYADVSGSGTLYSYTQVASGARHPYFVERTPYLVGLVELVEQPGLLMYTNLGTASLEDLFVGADVEVVFEPVAPNWLLPQFRLVNSRQSARTSRGQ
jgi:uncharacterized OB-fold protein